jgi:hypothetical protein
MGSSGYPANQMCLLPMCSCAACPNTLPQEAEAGRQIAALQATMTRYKAERDALRAERDTAAAAQTAKQQHDAAELAANRQRALEGATALSLLQEQVWQTLSMLLCRQNMTLG